MNNYINYISTLGLILVFSLIGSQSNAQIVAEPYPGNGPCGEIYAEYRIDASSVGKVTQSKGESIFRTSNSDQQESDWWSVDLGSIHKIHALEVYYSEKVYPEGFGDYYILLSNEPFEDISLNETLESPFVDHVYVAKTFKRGAEIPLGVKEAQFIKIYMRGEKGDDTKGDTKGDDDIKGGGGGVVILGPGPGPGGGSDEICDNGIDDDCDGKIDCADSDCGVTIFNTITTDPTSHATNDGVISIQAFSSSGTVTINGEPCNGLCILDGLDEGTYTVVISNGTCDETLTFTLVALTGDPDESDCNNGGFEDGDFTNWTTQTSTSNNQGVPGPFTNVNPINDPGFNLIQSGAVQDPNVVGGTVNSPTGGTFLAVLGDPGLSGGNDVYRMTNCFLVTAANADFAFNYALVMDDPNHPPNQQPYFEWEITVQGSGQVVDGNVATSGTSFFDTNAQNLSILNMSCASSDLTAFIGQTVCVEFTLAECAQGGHGAYAYIDAICQTASENAPECGFSLMSENVCGSQFLDIMLDNPNANNFDQFVVNICDGSNCSDLPIQNGFSIPSVDIEDVASQAGFNLVDGQTYTVEVHMENDCGECTSTQTFTYNDIPMTLDYPEWLVVCGNPTNVTIPGTATCPSCTYDWDPETYAVVIGSSTTPNPVLDGTTNVYAYQQAYTLTATAETPDGDPCVSTTTVNVTQNPFDLHCHSDLTYCAVDMGCTLTAPFPISPSDFIFRYYDHNNNREYPVTGVSVGPNSIQFDASIDRDEEKDLRLHGRYEFLGNSTAVLYGGNGSCYYQDFIGEYPNGIWSRPWRSYMPNAFSPNGDGNNDIFHGFFRSPTTDSEDGGCDYGLPQSSVYYLKLQIYDGWGGLMYEQEASVPMGSEVGLNGSEVYWDGFVRCGLNNSLCDNNPCNTGDICYSNGEPVTFNPDVYVYLLEVRSCTSESPCSGSDPTPCSQNQGEYCSSGGTTGTFFIASDVTIVL